jgi:hypothetical protein
MAKAKARVTVKAGARRQGRLRVVHAGFRGETEDAFRVRKRRPYIHTRCIEGILRLSGTYSEEGGIERERDRA